MKNKFTLKKKFETLYDLHAGNMYGCIIKIVQDEHKSQLYLKKIFQELYVEPRLNSEPIWFIKYAMNKAFMYLKQENDGSSYEVLINERITLIRNEMACSNPVLA